MNSVIQSISDDQSLEGHKKSDLKKHRSTFLWVLFLLISWTQVYSNVDHSKGRKVLFMGHSFFRNTVSYVEVHTENYGLTNHYQELVFRGGGNGAPGSLWNNQGSDIQKAKRDLEDGKFDTLAMTYFPSNSNVNDFKRWFDKAVKGNPDISLYVYIPWAPYNNMNYFMYRTATNIAKPIPLSIIRQLRDIYPNNKIYAVPMGEFMPQLWNLYNKKKMDEIKMVKAKNKKTDRDVCIFTDTLGHAGTIPSINGAMFWLASLYNVDLRTYDYDTETETDLRLVIQDIMDNEPLSSANDPDAPTAIPPSSEDESAALPWIERFNDLENDVDSDNGTTAWSVTTSNDSKAYFKVLTRKLRNKNNEGVMLTQLIDLSSSDASVEVSVQVSSKGPLTYEDYVDLIAVVDGVEVQLDSLSGAIENKVTLSGTVAFGETLQVKIVANNNADKEQYIFDNLMVK